MLYFWLLLLAHGIADFVLQTEKVSSAKCRSQWQGYTWHGAGVFLCTLAAIHFFGWANALWAALMVTGIHIALDWLKNTGRILLAKSGKFSQRPGVPGFLLDQALHILTLLWVWSLLEGPIHTGVAGFYGIVLSPVNSLPALDQAEKIVSVLAIYVLTSFGGAVLVRMSLDQLFPQGKMRGETSAGKYIGILERLLIMTLVAANTISAVGFVFTAKSIARFNEISDNRQFAEYYLVGTLVSFLVALLAGMALKQI